MNIFKKFPHYKQRNLMDCGPACLKIIAQYYGKNISIQQLRKLSHTNRSGSSLLGLSKAAEKINLRTLILKVTFDQIKNDVTLPCIVFWKDAHFLILYRIKKDTCYVSDPNYDLIKFSKNEFIKGLTNKTNGENETGYVMLLQPNKQFHDQNLFKEESRNHFRFLYNYIKPYKSFVNQLLLGVFVGSLLSLVFPFLTQAIIDIGIRRQDIDFIYLILFAQLMVFSGRTTIGIIRSWILLHLSKRINISLLADYFMKMMNLPIASFDSTRIGDYLQRINDHERVERLLTSTSLNTLFSLVNLIVFGIVLAIYSWIILLVFAGFTIFYCIWIILFLKKRRDLDYKSFIEMSDNQGKIVEILHGMQEIKLNNAEKQKRWEWEHIQARLFKISLKTLTLDQIQETGALFINELKNIIITFIAAKLILDGQVTLGMMLAISYIIGQLNNPIIQLIEFITTSQDAFIAIDRISEIYEQEDEYEVDGLPHYLEQDIGISMQNVSFRYDKAAENYTLKNITFEIPANKTTAIVGTSGSGKTTLLKLLLKFYKPEKGEISVGKVKINNIPNDNWREKCGVVMQEGIIFPGSIYENITLGQEFVDETKLEQAVNIANIGDFIHQLPKGFNTLIGKDGTGLSTGQKQRLLIARAVYKEPRILFFDEATSALDANNEKKIIENLEKFFINRTVFVIAHRLSTVKNADQIIVIDDGTIAEKGDHKSLVDKKGIYFNLIKNQLELGN